MWKYDGLSKSAVSAQNWGIFQIRMDQRGDRMKMNFDYFQIQKWMLQTVWKEKVDDKKWGHLSSFHVFFLSYGPSIVRKSALLQFYTDFNKKPKSNKAIYMLHLKVLTKLFRKMIWFIGDWATIHKISAIKISKKMMTQQKFYKVMWLQNLISPK